MLRESTTFLYLSLLYCTPFSLSRRSADKQASKNEAEKADAEAKFKAMGEAYEVLSCPEKKQR